MSTPISDIRKTYAHAELLESDAAAAPMEQFDRWWAQALEAKIEEVNAMTLATVDASGMPDARIVLLKGVDEVGFHFYSNYQSRKGMQLTNNEQACLVFFWKELERQIRIEGVLEKVSEENSNEYFKTRPRESQIGAWASPQSTTITRAELEKRVEEFTKKFEGQEVPRPEHWGGFRLIPARFEFWQGRPNRLHDRIRFLLQEDYSWKIDRLSP